VFEESVLDGNLTFRDYTHLPTAPTGWSDKDIRSLRRFKELSPLGSARGDSNRLQFDRSVSLGSFTHASAFSLGPRCRLPREEMINDA